jgi:hypothetical protein
MSIDTDIATALATVANGKCWPDIAPEGSTPPFVVFRRRLFERVQVLQGAEGLQHSEYVFECVGKKTDTRRAKEDARVLAASVRSAIEACKTTTLRDQYEVPADGDEYEPEAMEVMEPVAFSFWHPA